MMQPWFPDAKLGIFIHYGIYAVKGIPESWSFFNGQISYPDYMSQLDGFTAAKYDPEAWADLFVEAGAKYAVLTSKHHDGVALWDTKANDLSVVQKTPAGRDLLTPYIQALRKRGLKVGIYYSHLDWSHPDYPTVIPGSDSPEQPDPNRYKNRFAYPEPGKQDPVAWERFLEFHRAQLKELCTQFGEIDLLWFDGDWERDPEQFRMKELRDQLHEWQPNCILNSRMLGYGDYATPEQGIPSEAPEGPWEFCVTVNDSWGYQVQDHNHKKPSHILRMFVECLAMGGNMLLDVGPREDGTILDEQADRLRILGDWIRKHEEAVYGTIPGLPESLFYGRSTMSKDRETLYLMFFDIPRGEVAVKGVRNKIKRITALGSTEELKHTRVGGADWSEIPGVLWIETPESILDPYVTVLKVELEGPADLYTGKGRS